MRFPEISRDQMYYEQWRVAQLVNERREGGLAGPFIPLVYTPAILDSFQLLGEYCRFNKHFPRALVELAILVTARKAKAPFEFFVHAPAALRYGISEADIDAIAAERVPQYLDTDGMLVYEFCDKLFAKDGARKDVFAAVGQRFGRAAALDLAGICGYYATLGLVLNVTQLELPEGANSPFVVEPD